MILAGIILCYFVGTFSILTANLQYLATVRCFDIENKVTEKPTVHCAANSIAVDINTEKPFLGRLYVQGEVENHQCLQTGSADRSSHAHFELPIGACNMRRQRTMHPRGVSFSFTLVVSFHPFFVTGMDRAFHVRCFFLESVKSLGTEYDVGQLRTEVVEQDFQLPDCIYHLHDGPTGPPVHFAQVGQRVTHRWSCEDGSKHIYGLLIHSCFADDGQDNKFELVDDRGCSTDTYLLPQIRYDAKSLSAFTDAHVFKYADKVQLYFTCTVQLCYKHDGGCDGVTPPTCDGADAAHSEHMDGPPKEHTSSEGPPFRIPDFPQDIPFEHLHGNGHPGPEHGPPGNEDLFQGILNGPAAPEKLFFSPIDIPKEFNRPPYKDSPLNETDIDEISVITGNLTAIDDAVDKTKKKRRDLNMETDLSIDVIVLPFEKTKSGRPLVPAAHICVSRTASLLLLLVVIITIALFVVIAVIITRRSPPYHKAMDAFH